MSVRDKYTKKSRMSDFNYFINNYKNFYKKYGHSYIVIKNKNVLGAYKNVNEAIDNAKMPLGSYILQECNGKESGYTSYVTSFNLFKSKNTLIDTGANISCISKKLVKELKLVPVGVAKVSTPSGTAILDKVYL